MTRGDESSDAVREESAIAPDDLNRAEWQRPENWSSGPKWLSAYFSHQDTRTWVPKRIASMGWTLNLAKASGVAWLIATFGLFWSIGCLIGFLIGFLFGSMI